MGKEYLIDTNVVIGYLDGKIDSDGMSFMHPIIDTTPNISIINKIEILRFNTSENDYKMLLSFVEASNVLNLTEDIIQTTISICKLTKIKLPDAIIAATALAHNLILITRNTADFKKIETLELYNPWAIS